MKLADYIIQYLADLGIRKVFVVYGAACADLIDAFTRIKGISYVAVMHEQAGAFAAETYAKVSGKLGVAIATSGPGGINLLNGIANCYYDSIPCLFITGQINSQFIKSSPALRQVGFQENDIVAMARPITKMAEMLRSPQDIGQLLPRAIITATTGRPGPVLLDIPTDVQKASIEPELESVQLGSQFESNRPSSVVETQISEFVADLKKAARPVLLAGGGIWLAKAATEIRELGAKLRVPCIPTWNALDIFTSDYEFYRGRVGTYGGPGRNFAIQNADLLLCIGTRVSGRITGGYVEAFAREAKKYIIDIDPANLNPELQQVKGDVNILCDAKTFIGILMEQLEEYQLSDTLEWLNKTSEWLNKTLEWRDKYQPCLSRYYEEKGRVNPYVFIKILSEELEAGDVIIGDCGGNVVVTNQTFETKWGQRLCSSNGNSPMGYSFAGAMGACFVPGVKRVICLIGDGGFNMNIQELQTVKNYRLPLKTFIMNNQVYGIAKQFQDTNFGSRYEASGPKGYNPPDFIPIVSAYGIAVAIIQDHKDLRHKIRAVLNFPGAIVCDVNMLEYFDYAPRVSGWKTPIEDMYPHLPREEFASNMIIKPVEGWEKVGAV